MDTLHTYSSSSSESELHTEDRDLISDTSHPDTAAPPPPHALEAVNVNSASRNGLHRTSVSLPPVIPLQENVDKFLVHVFIQLDHPELSSFVQALLAQTRLAFVGNPIKPILTTLTDFHISISRPAVIQSIQIHSLVNQLRKALTSRPRAHVQIRCVPLAFHSKNQRRLFIAAPVATKTPHHDDFTLTLIQLVSSVFERNGLPRFFDDPRPHMSFACTETVDVSSVFSEPDFEDSKQRTLTVPVDKVFCTIGKSKYCFPLK